MKVLSFLKKTGGSLCYYFMSYEKLKEHKNHVHEPLICGDCGHMFNGSRNMQLHKLNHKRSTCPNCNKVLFSRNMSKHKCKAEQNETGKKKRKKVHKFICDKCGTSRETQKKLDEHSATHDKVKEKAVHKCTHCDYTTSWPSNLKRHKKSCVEMKRQKAPDPVSNKKLVDLFSDCHVSISDFNKILDFFMKQMGNQFFESGAMKCVQDYCSSMNVFSTAETVKFIDSNKIEISRTLAYISDPKGFIEDVLKGRDISQPKIVLGCDYGKDKLIVTASIYDENDMMSMVSNPQVHRQHYCWPWWIWCQNHMLTSQPSSRSLVSHGILLQISDLCVI